MDTAPITDESTVVGFAERLKALGDPHRLRILYMLMTCGERCVCECVLALELTQSNLSFHLKTLKQAGFIKSRKSGKWMYYCLNREVFQQFLAEFTQVFDASKWPETPQSTVCDTAACERVGCEKEAR